MQLPLPVVESLYLTQHVGIVALTQPASGERPPLRLAEPDGEIPHLGTLKVGSALATQWDPAYQAIVTLHASARPREYRAEHQLVRFGPEEK